MHSALEQLLEKIEEEKEKINVNIKCSAFENIHRNREIIRSDLESEYADPLTLLPREIWENILKRLTGDKAIFSCYKTCGLFRELINSWSTEAEVYFASIFPFVSPFLNKQDILKCRYVCKMWYHDLDEYLATRKLSKTYYHNNLFGQGILVGCADSGHRNTTQNVPPGAKFVGKTVMLQKHEQKVRYDLVMLKEIQNLLQHAGKNLVNLELFDTYRSASGNLIISEDHLYRLCVLLLEQGKNLRKLCLHECTQFGAECQTNDSTGSSPELPNHNRMQYLSTHGVEKYPALYQALLQKYFKQLIWLEVMEWDANSYFGLHWKNLETLVVTLNYEIHLENLKNLDAPNLKNLSIRPSGGRPPTEISEIMNVVQRFPLLNTLHLNLSYLSTKCLELSRNECRNVFQMSQICNPTVRRLDLSLSEPLDTFDFLVFFPQLRQLKLVLNKLDDFTEKLKYLEMAREDECVVRLVNQLLCLSGDQRQSIYNSNVWELLPRLECFDIVLKTYVKRDKFAEKPVKRFTRRGYNFFNHL